MFCFARGMNGSFARLYTSAASGGSSVQEQLTPAMPRWVPLCFLSGLWLPYQRKPLPDIRFLLSLFLLFPDPEFFPKALQALLPLYLPRCSADSTTLQPQVCHHIFCQGHVCRAIFLIFILSGLSDSYFLLYQYDQRLADQILEATS